MTAPPPTPPGWYPDPSGRQHHRWWDGVQWTDAASTNGVQVHDPVQHPPIVPTGDRRPDQVQRSVQQRAGHQDVGQGGGTLFTEPVLVVSQKAKVIELENEYAVYDQHGNQIAAVRQTGQSTARKALRAFTNLDQMMSHSLQITDLHGNVLLAISRPTTFMKSTFTVADGAGREVGRIAQQNVIGKIRFGLESGGHQVGALRAENWRAWDFHIVDHAETEVARITKTFEGLTRALFTTADDYVVRFHHHLEDPLRSLVVASALSVDTALKQQGGGFG
jgi:uncharacterized protein YxjI